MKIKSSPDVSALVTQLFGEDIIDKIISPDLDQKLLNNLENTLTEIILFKNKLINNHNPSIDHEQENLFNKNFSNKNISHQNNLTNLIIENNDYPEKKNFYIKKNIQNINNGNFNLNSNPRSNLNSNILLENNLLLKRSNSKYSINSINNTSKLSRSKSKGKRDFFEDLNENPSDFQNVLRKYKGDREGYKIFKNYFNKIGGFFDPSLQKGGLSTEDLKRRTRANSKPRQDRYNFNKEFDYNNDHSGVNSNINQSHITNYRK